MKKIQVYRQIDGELPEGIWDNDDIFFKFIKEYSKFHKAITKIYQLGKGGESRVLVGQMLAKSIMIKVPIDPNQ